VLLAIQVFNQPLFTVQMFNQPHVYSGVGNDAPGGWGWGRLTTAVYVGLGSVLCHAVWDLWWTKWHF